MVPCIDKERVLSIFILYATNLEFTIRIMYERVVFQISFIEILFCDFNLARV